MTTNEKPKAVGYTRVSSKDQEDTGYSLPAQEKLLREYALRGNLELIKVFAIQESAAGKIQRKIFHEMMAYVTKAKITTIIVETTDRLTRNFADVPTIDNWILADESHNIQLVKENCTLHKDSKSHEWFMWRVKVATAEYYIRLLSENVKKGQKEKLAQGWLPSKPPIGYMTVGEKGHKTHVIDKERAPFARKMFELYATGNYSVKKVANEMFAMGMRSRGGYKVSMARMHQLLRDPFYYGMNRWNGKITPGEHKPIIPKELFQRVQDILDGRYAPRYAKHDTLFKGAFRCVECRGTITWETHKGFWYGHCNHFKNCTQTEWVRQDHIEKQLAEKIMAVSGRSERLKRLIEWVQHALKEDHSEEITLRENAVHELERQYAMASHRLDKLYDDKIDGKISAEFYEKKFTQYKKEQEDLLDNLNKQKDASLKYYDVGVTILEIAKRAYDIYRSPRRTPEQKRRLLSFLFESMKIDGKQIMTQYHLPFSLIAGVSEKIAVGITTNYTFELAKNRSVKGKTPAFADVHPIWLRGWDSNPEPKD